MTASRKRTPSKPSKLSRIPHVLLLIETSGAFGRGAIEGIGRYAAEHGPWYIKIEYRSLDSRVPRWLKAWKGDGIISRTFNDAQAKLVRGMKIPCVELLGRPRYQLAEVRCDFAKEVELVVEHFADHGLRHYAYFSFGDSWWIRQIIEQYRRLLNERNCECHVFQVAKRGLDMNDWDDRHQPRIVQWLKSLPRPIGILTAGDLHAAHLLDICREQKIAVPEEAAILGRGNDPVICETVRPTLSSINLDGRRIGYEAARLLDVKMTGKDAQGPVRVPPINLAVRQSTDLTILEDSDVAQAVRFIRDNACSGIDVPAVAERIGVSRRVLERRFLHYLGRTPKAEIIRVRIERAKTLLATTDRSRQGISKSCGFNTPQYFSKIFYRLVGMKPHAYRKTTRISRDFRSQSDGAI